MCEYRQYRELSLAVAISAHKNPVTYVHMYLQHNHSRLCFTLQSSIGGSLLNCLSHQRTVYVRTMYPYTITSITCICNILGQEHMCGTLTKLNILLTSLWPLKLNILLTLLWPLLSIGMKVRMVIFMFISCTCTECVSPVHHLASANTPFDS